MVFFCSKDQFEKNPDLTKREYPILVLTASSIKADQANGRDWHQKMIFVPNHLLLKELYDKIKNTNTSRQNLLNLD